MKLKASDWNEAMRDLCTRYPLSVRVKDQDPPEHAWFVRPLWNEERRKWTATIKPGSVNCRIATISMQFSKSSDEFQDYVQKTNPKKTFNQKTIVHVPLDFMPTIDLAWREIGGDATPTNTTGDAMDGITNSYEPVPVYFKNKGVVPGGATNFDPALRCRLFACDIVLSMPRPYLVNEISSFPGGLLGGSIVSVDAVPVTPPDVSEPPSIYATSKFVVPPVQNSFSDIFFQRFLDEPKDDLHLSTIYALSPPRGTGLGLTGIDATYKLQTRYYCHYNLAHATSQVVPRVITPPLRLVTGLGAGLGDAMFNLILSTANDFAQATVDLFNQRSLRGMFWVI
jgi:hypothetical protein